MVAQLVLHDGKLRCPRDAVVLLTCAVQPHLEMTYTGLRNVQERLNDYVKAIAWWLTNTPYNIVLVEDTGYDLQPHLADSKRIELLSCNFDSLGTVRRGKGYCEGLAMQFAYTNSAFLASSNLHIKCSGRYTVPNIASLVAELCGLICAGPLATTSRWCESVCFLYRPRFFHQYFLPRLPTISDDEGYKMEQVLHATIMEAMHVYGEIAQDINITCHGRSGYRTVIA